MRSMSRLADLTKSQTARDLQDLSAQRQENCLHMMAGNPYRLTTRSFLLLLFLYIQFFHGLGQIGLVGPDEPRYAQVAREMMLSGDYITPRLYGQPWFEKPVLYYWLPPQCYSG